MIVTRHNPLLLLLLCCVIAAPALFAINATWNGGPNNADWQDITQWTPILGAGQQPGFDLGSGNRASFASALDAVTLSSSTLATTLLDVQRENVRFELSDNVTLNAATLDLAADASLTIALATSSQAATVNLVNLNAGANSSLTITAGVTLILAGTSYDFSNLTLTNAGTIIFDAATAGADVTITEGENLGGAIRIESANGAGVTFDALHASSFTLRGAGDVVINGNTQLSGAVDKEGAGLLRFGSIPGDTSELGGNIAIKQGDFSLPGNALFSGANISFVGAGNVAIGDTIFTGAIQSLTLDSSRDITGFIRVDDGAQLTVNSALVVSGPLYVGTGLSGSLELLGDTTFEGDVSIARQATVRARRALVFERDFSVGDSAEFVAEASSSFTDPGFATSMSVHADVALMRFNRDLTINGDLVLRSIGGVPNAAPGTLQVDGNLIIAANISDSNDASLSHVLNLELAGDMVFTDIAELDLPQVNVLFNGPGAQALRLASGSPTGGVITTGAWTLAQSVTVSQSLPDATTLVIGGLSVGEGKSIDLSDYNTTIAASVTFGANTSFAQSGAVAGTSGTITLDASNADWDFDATLEVMGDLIVTDGGAGNAVRVLQGHTLTLRGSLSVTSGGFGAATDADMETGRAWINVYGDLSVANGATLLPGEGTWRFYGDIDLSAGDGLVALPEADNNEAARIELMGGITSLKFSNGGSHFWVDQVEPITAVRQTGRMVLAGTLDLSRSNANPAWDGTRDFDAIEEALALGSRERGNAIAADTSPWQVILGAQPVMFERLEARNVESGQADNFNSFRIAPASGVSNPTLWVGEISFEGDALSDDDAAAEDANAPRVWIEDVVLTIGRSSQLGAGANGNAGAWLRIDDCTLTLERDAAINLAAAGLASAEGATLLIYDSTVSMGRDSSLTGGAFSRLEIRALDTQRVSITGTEDWDFTIDSANAASTWLSNVDIRPLGSGMPHLRVGGAVRVRNCAFWDTDDEGLRIAGSTQLLAFADNTFHGPLVGGAWPHITFEAPGLIAGSITGAIGNRFVGTNASHMIENNTTNGRALVVGSMSNDFGTREDGTPLTATNTRVRDVNAQGNIIVLSDLEGLGVSLGATQPTQLAAGGGRQDLLNFDLNGVGPNTVRALSFRVRINDGDLVQSDFLNAQGALSFALSDGSETLDIATGMGATLTASEGDTDFTVTFAGLEQAFLNGALTALPILEDRSASYTLSAEIGDFAGSTSITVELASITRAVDGSRVTGLADVRNTGLSIVPATLTFTQEDYDSELDVEAGTPLVVLDVSVSNASSLAGSAVSGTEISQLVFAMEVRSVDPAYDPSNAVNNLPGAGVFSLYLDVNGDGLPGLGEVIDATGEISPSMGPGGNLNHTLTFTLNAGALQIAQAGSARLLVVMGVANDSAGAFSAAVTAELSIRLRLLASGVSQTHAGTTILAGDDQSILALNNVYWGLLTVRGKGKVDDSCTLNGSSDSHAWLLMLALLAAPALFSRRRAA